MEILTQNLNDSQKAAVLCTQGPLIIFAGAGTGKTRVITHRIAYLLSQGVAPWNILAVTFTNKAAQEMQKRVIELVPQAGANVFISTFHSFCAYFLRVEAEKIGLTKDFLIYDFGEQKNLVKDCIKELRLDEKKFKPSSITERISRAKDDLKTPADSAKDAENLGDLFSITTAKIYALYKKKLETAQALDFGDLIMRTVTTLQEYPAILEKYQEKFKYIMVDEYQDTNHAQYVLTELLAKKHRNICVVGDDDQSVYSWRGADINNILDFETDYPDAKSVKLEQNYRSTPKILETAYKVVKHNSNRVEKKLWTQNPDDGLVTVIKAANENDEAAKVVDLITLNSHSGKYNLSDFAVFYRTNAQSRVFEDAFSRANMPYVIIGTLRFYERAEIKDIMAYLKLIHNTNDNISFKRIINVPGRKIGKTSIEYLEQEALKRNLSLWGTIPYAHEAGLSQNTATALNNFAELIKACIKLKETETAKEIAERVITAFGYLRMLEDENSPEAQTKIENIQELISAIDNFEERSPDKSLSAYLTQIALASDLDSLDETQGKVTLMTLHLAKGLEFDNVFITGVEEGLFPFDRNSFNRGFYFTYDPKELEEERRLMYVGMTRARKHLYMLWTSERTIGGQKKSRIMSKFLSEAGFKDEFSDRQKPGLFQKPFMNQGFNRTKWVKDSKPKSKYNAEDTYDYIPSDDEMMQDEPLYKPETDKSPYQIGVLVKHPIFGNGKIIEKSGIGDDLKLVILFENGQWKKLLARVANLTLI